VSDLTDIGLTPTTQSAGCSCCCSASSAERRGDAGSTAVDPVCGMDVDAATAITGTFDGQAYFFCAPGCRRAFEKDPSRYLAPA